MKYWYNIDKKDKRKRRIALLLEMLCGDRVFSFFVRTFHAQACSHVSCASSFACFMRQLVRTFLAPAVSYLIMSTERFRKASRAAPFNMPF